MDTRARRAETVPTWHLGGYDQPFDTKIFDLEDEVPPDVMRFEPYTGDDVNDVGLPEGALTDKQIAFEVVRRFFEALIAKDYAKAGQLFGGMPHSVL